MGVFGDVAAGLVGIWVIDKVTGKRKRVYVKKRKSLKAKALKTQRGKPRKRSKSAFDSVFHAK